MVIVQIDEVIHLPSCQVCEWDFFSDFIKSGRAVFTPIYINFEELPAEYESVGFCDAIMT